MVEERRPAARKAGLTATIDLDDGWACLCLVQDISGGGAMLTSLDPVAVPDVFRLKVAGAKSRKCQVV